jgi:phage-related tail protein
MVSVAQAWAIAADVAGQAEIGARVVDPAFGEAAQVAARIHARLDEACSVLTRARDDLADLVPDAAAAAACCLEDAAQASTEIAAIAQQLNRLAG